MVHAKSSCNIVFVHMRIEKKIILSNGYIVALCSAFLKAFILLNTCIYIIWMQCVIIYMYQLKKKKLSCKNLKMFDKSTLSIKIISKGDLTKANKLRKRFAFLRRMLKAWQHKSTNSWNLSLCFSPLLMT